MRRLGGLGEVRHIRRYEGAAAESRGGRWSASAATALGILAVLPLSAGCGSALPRATSAAERPARPFTIEQIATAVGCTPELRGKSAGYRQGSCKTSAGNYVLNTFDSDTTQREWLDEATAYGGHYLVGTRWVVVAGPKQLETLRSRLGGKIIIAGHS